MDEETCFCVLLTMLNQLMDASQVSIMQIALDYGSVLPERCKVLYALLADCRHQCDGAWYDAPLQNLVHIAVDWGHDWG
jgi:hypothetical protein